MQSPEDDDIDVLNDETFGGELEGTSFLKIRQHNVFFIHCSAKLYCNVNMYNSIFTLVSGYPI